MAAHGRKYSADFSVLGIFFSEGAGGSACVLILFRSL